MNKRRIAILGCTGSIGKSALDIARAFPDRLEIVGVSAHSNWPGMKEVIEEFRPRWAVMTDNSIEPPTEFPSTKMLRGPDSLSEMMRDPELDMVLVAIVGAAGLTSTWAAVEVGKSVAVANKETLVMAGPLVMEKAARTGAAILPVDSEHSAIFQILRERSQSAISYQPSVPNGKGATAGLPSSANTPLPDISHGLSKDIAKIVLTASGGPFRGRKRHELENVAPKDALKHPTWQMGPKITVDSATLMNKALEIIEARWLFNVAPEQIDVVIHPESVIHSFVEFTDGSVIAQLSPPDMRLPIQFALTYPDRLDGPAKRLEWKQLRSLNFEEPDIEAFPALELGHEVARRGGTCGSVFNAANEAAVARFLNNDLRFLDIPQVCREVLESHNYSARPSLSELMAIDKWARQEVDRWRSG